MSRGEVESIELAARRAAGDLACAFGIGFAAAPPGFLEELARGIIPPVRDLDDGVEVSFTMESEDAVRRYMEIESRRRPALILSVRRSADAIVLTVRGRLEP